MTFPVLLLECFSPGFNDALLEHIKPRCAHRVDKLQNSAQSTNSQQIFGSFLTLMREIFEHNWAYFAVLVDCPPKSLSCLCAEPALLFPFQHRVEIIFKIYRIGALSEFVVFLQLKEYVHVDAELCMKLVFRLGRLISLHSMVKLSVALHRNLNHLIFCVSVSQHKPAPGRAHHVLTETLDVLFNYRLAILVYNFLKSFVELFVFVRMSKVSLQGISPVSA